MTKLERGIPLPSRERRWQFDEAQPGDSYLSADRAEQRRFAGALRRHIRQSGAPWATETHPEGSGFRTWIVEASVVLAELPPIGPVAPHRDAAADDELARALAVIRQAAGAMSEPRGGRVPAAVLAGDEGDDGFELEVRGSGSAATRRSQGRRPLPRPASLPPVE